MMARFDLWIGKTFFVPIDIRLCQWLKITQYALSAYLWTIAMMVQLSQGPQILGWGIYTIAALAVLFWVVVAALVPDIPRSSNYFFRWLIIITLVVDLGISAAEVAMHAPLTLKNAICVDIMVLFAEYALTIKTIPPLEAKEKKVSAKLAKEGA